MNKPQDTTKRVIEDELNSMIAEGLVSHDPESDTVTRLPDPTASLPERSFGLRAERQSDHVVVNGEYRCGQYAYHHRSGEAFCRTRKCAAELSKAQPAHTPESSPDSKGVEQQHSPLPWYVDRLNEWSRWIRSDAPEIGFPIAHIGANHAPDIQDANAAYLVRAANVHGVLVEALEAALPHLDTMFATPKRQAYELALAALAAAKGNIK